MRTFLWCVATVVVLGLAVCQETSATPASDETQSRSDSSDNPQSSKGEASTNEAESSEASAEKNVGVAPVDEDERKKGVADHDGGRGPDAGRGRGMGRGFRGGRGFGGPGGGGNGGFRADMTTIHSMFDDRDKIRRTVKLCPDGAEAWTESDDEKIVALIQDHVPNMDSRVLSNEPLPPMTFHPVFVALIKNADKYTMDYEETDKGVKATYQSDDPYVVMLVQEHAKLVSRFIKNGHSEMHAEYDLPKFDAKVAVAKAKAIKARDALFKRLSTRLMGVIQEQGAAAAIEACSKEAPRIAQKIADEHDVKIGRTSLKLRNQKNSAPGWVKPLLKTQLAEAKFVNLNESTLGALLPIRMQSKCVVCHGPRESLKDDIQDQLAKLYPNDSATGFKEGDLRGWFWVEAPVKTAKEVK